MDGDGAGVADDEELLGLIDAAVVGHGAAPALAAPAADDGGAIVEGLDDGDDEDVVALLGVAQAKARPQWRQRSAELCKLARVSKAEKRSAKEAAVASETAGVSNKRLAILQWETRGERKGGHDLVAQQHLTPLQLAACKLRFACMHPNRVAHTPHLRHARAAFAVTRTILVAQQSGMSAAFARETYEFAEASPTGVAADRAPPPPRAVNRIGTYAGMWDETKQRIKRWRHRLETNASSEQTHVEIMMQHGEYAVFVSMSDGSIQEVVKDPFFFRGMKLEGQSADHILEGLLRFFPLPLSDAQRFMRFTRGCDIVYVLFGMDRASVNDVVTRWLFKRLLDLSLRMPCEVIPAAEYCWCHGICLVKKRSVDHKTLATDLSGLSRQMRDGRFKRELMEVVVKIIPRLLDVRFARRPRAHDALDDMLIKTLFGGRDTEFMYKVVGGRRVEKPWVRSMRRYLSTLCIHDDPEQPEHRPGRMVHYCFVTEDSEEHLVLGKAVGRPCCQNREESIGVVIQSTLDFIFGRGWEASEVGRWTYALHLLRKFIVATIGPRLLPAALSDLQCTWGLEEAGLEAVLTRLVAADREDWRSTQKLRLLKACKKLCPAEACHQIAITCLALAITDQVIYAILGNEQRGRATMYDLANGHLSPISDSIDKLTRLLADFRADAEPCLLLKLVGVNFASELIKKYARRNWLQIHAGLFDFGDRILSRAPYSCVHVCNGSPAAVRQRSVAAFYREARECLPMVCQRWRHMYATEADFILNAPHTVDTFLRSTLVAIDFVERAHGAMRLDVHSSGPAKSFTASANRVVCREAHACHTGRGGVELTREAIETIIAAPDPELAAVCAAAAVSPAAGGVLVGDAASLRPRGSPYLRLKNLKRSAYKELHAPCRKLTQQEEEDIKGSARAQYRDMDADARQSLLLMPPVRPTAPRRAVQPVEKPFQPLWSNSRDKHTMVDLAQMMDLNTAISRTCGEKCRDDGDLAVVAQVQPRAAADDLVDAHVLHGCYGHKKNICRRHGLVPADALELDAMTTFFTSFAKSLGRTVVEDCEVVFWLEHRKPEEEELGGEIVAHHDMIIVLADARWQPLCQYFLACHLRGRDPTDINFEVPTEFPFEVQISEQPPRMDPTDTHMSLCWFTSDELAAHALNIFPSNRWRITRLSWSFPETSSLLDMRILGLGDVFESAPRKVAQPTWWPREFSDANPFASRHSRPSPAASSSAGVDVVGSSLEGAAEPADALDEHGSDEGALDHLEMVPPEAVELDDATFDALVSSGGHDGSGGMGGHVEDGAVGPDAPCEEALEDDDLFGEGDDSGGDAPPSAEEAADNSIISDYGTVTCALEPWSSLTSLGRLTTWPASKPMEQRSASMSCRLHPKCSAAKMRRVATDRDFLLWLYSGTIPDPSDSAERRRELGREHMAMWAERWR